VGRSRVRRDCWRTRRSSASDLAARALCTNRSACALVQLVGMGASGFRRLAGKSAVVGPIFFTAAWFVAWAVQDEYSLRREDISALAALDAEQPWIMVVGFLALGLGIVVLGLALGNVLAGGLSGRVGALLVTVAGLGTLVAGLARNDCSSELAACKARGAGELSWHHHVHDLSSLVVFLALVAAQLVLGGAFGRDERWHDLRSYSITSGALTFALLVLYGSGAAGDWNGLVQRVFTAVRSSGSPCSGSACAGTPSQPRRSERSTDGRGVDPAHRTFPNTRAADRPFAGSGSLGLLVSLPRGQTAPS
jgi:hypothetical membrane protein